MITSSQLRYHYRPRPFERPLLLARLIGHYCLLAGNCCLSSSVTLPAGGPAGRPPGAWAVGRPTLHGGPERLRSVRATPCFVRGEDRLNFSAPLYSPSSHPTDSVKVVLTESQSITHWPHVFIIHGQTPHRRRVPCCFLYTGSPTTQLLYKPDATSRRLRVYEKSAIASKSITASEGI